MQVLKTIKSLQQQALLGKPATLLSPISPLHRPSQPTRASMSWEFRDSSHEEAYRRGSMMVMMGPAQDRANRDTSVYPGSGPSRLEVNPYFLPASN
jgi:hypothetical protein